MVGVSVLVGFQLAGRPFVIGLILLLVGLAVLTMALPYFLESIEGGASLTAPGKAALAAAREFCVERA